MFVNSCLPPSLLCSVPRDKQMITNDSNSTYEKTIGQKVVFPPEIEKFVDRSVPAARQILAHYKNLSSSSFNKPPRAGYLRGIDFYSSNDLVKVIAFLLVQHRLLYQENLNLIRPQSYTEKINWSKLFREYKIPESGNKLMTKEFIPTQIKDFLSCPPVVWHSPFPVLPNNDSIVPGEYYLKANHGSHLTKKIHYPLSNIEKRALEQTAAGWLTSGYGLHSGEWFYNVFQRELMLEQSVTKNVESISWNVYVFGGEIEMISAYQKKTGGGSRSTWFDRNFDVFRVQVRDKERAVGTELSRESRANIVEFALEMSKQTDNVRFDFLVGDEGRVFLGEVTLTTLSGQRAADRNFDFSFGEKWLIVDG